MEAATRVDRADRTVDPVADYTRDFGRLYERTAVSILKYFWLRTHDAQLAADLTAETYCAALSAIHTFDPTRGNDEAWLLGIAQNQLRRFLRRGRAADRARRRLGIPPQPIDDTSIARIEELVDLAAIRPRLLSALAELPRGQAAAVRMRVIEERTYDEIARELGCSQAAARVRVSRGLSKLAESLGEAGDG